VSAQQGELLTHLALKSLRKANLVQWETPSAAVRSIDRRQVIARIGGLALIPVVYTLVAPTAAEAQSLVCTCIKDAMNCTPFGTKTGNCYMSSACNTQQIKGAFTCTDCFMQSGAMSWTC
jgi:hypothetical protein